MGKHSGKKKKIRIKDPKRLIILVTIVIAIILAITIKDNIIKHKDYLSLIINNEDVTNKLENEIIIKENIEYLSFNDVKNCLDTSIYQEDDKIITSSDKKVAVLELDSDSIEINSSTIKIKGQPFKSPEGIIYLPVSELKNVYDIQVTYAEDYKNIVIESYSQRLEKAYLRKTLPIKENTKFFSPNVDKVSKGDWIVYISEEKGWAKVRTQNGNLGYVKKKYLTNFIIEREEMHQENKTAEDTAIEKDITKNNIEKYEDRKNVIEQILQEAVSKKQKTVKIIYKNDADTEIFQRFKIESTAILKECGISIIFENN